MINIDTDQEQVHGRGRVGADDQRVTREDDASDQIDDPQADDGGHQHGNHNQGGAKVTNQFINRVCVHGGLPFHKTDNEKQGV